MTYQIYWTSHEGIRRMVEEVYFSKDAAHEAICTALEIIASRVPDIEWINQGSWTIQSTSEHIQ